MTFLFYIVMINNVKSQIQSLNLLQKGNQRSIRPEGTINVLGIAGSLRQESYSTLGLKTALKWADALILASPDYHGSMSGTVKNFLDYFWEEFAGKTFGYIVASHEKGLTVADQMRTAIRQCYGWSMPYNISINGEKDFDSKGTLVNSTLAKRLKMLARDLVIYGTLIRKQFLSDVADHKISDSFASRYRSYYN